ncbi:hypothetical protein GEMRC1_008318 [Eukaryota sp. GEM-RC1]
MICESLVSSILDKLCRIFFFMYTLKASALCIIGSFFALTGILASAAMSIYFNGEVWEGQDYVYLSDMGGKYPSSVPFVWGLNVAGTMFYISVQLLSSKVKARGSRSTCRLLKLASMGSAIFLSLLSIVSTFDDAKVHAYLTWSFFACSALASVFLFSSSMILRQAEKPKFPLRICGIQFLLFSLFVGSCASLGYYSFIHEDRRLSVYSEYCCVGFLIAQFGYMSRDLETDVIHYYQEFDELVTSLP